MTFFLRKGLIVIPTWAEGPAATILPRSRSAPQISCGSESFSLTQYRMKVELLIYVNNSQPARKTMDRQNAT
jgi:hypothetical protein